MKTKRLAAVAAFAVVGLTSTSALASVCASTGGNGTTIFTASCTEGGVTINVTTQTLASLGGFSDTLTAPGFTMIDNFNGATPAVAGGFSVSGGAFDTGNNSNGANPPGDDTQYESVLPASSFTLTALGGPLTALSFVMGSPDDGNSGLLNNLSLTVNGVGPAFTLTGSDVWGGQPAGGGNQAAGFLVTYNFTPNAVQSLTFSQSGGPAFEFDNLAGSVPEPASWALMIMGFGAAGAMLRGKRRQATAA